MKLPYEFWKDDYDQRDTEGATRKGVIARAIRAIWKKPFCTFVPCIPVLRHENVFYFPAQFMISGSDTLPIEVVVNMVERNRDAYERLTKKMKSLVSLYQDGIRYHLRDTASRMVADRCIEDQPREEKRAKSSASAGRVARAFGSLAEASSQEAEAISSASAAEAQAGGDAACLGATKKAAKSESTEASKSKGKGKDKG